jgi:hypothetical protein
VALLLEQAHQPLLRERVVAPPVPPVDAPRQVDRVVDARRERDQLGLAEHQDAVRPQRIVEPGKHPLLQRGVEVDEDVAADEEIEPGDGRIADQVVDPEYDAAAQFLAHRVRVSLLDEPLRQGFLRDGFHLVARVLPLARVGDRLLVHVGAEDLDVLVAERGAHRLGQGHPGGERLLAGCAAGAPDADLLARALLREHLRDGFAGEVLPCFRIPEEGSDLDEYRAEQRIELGRLAIEERAVLAHRALLAILHAPLDAPQQLRALVIAEVEVPRVPDLAEDLLEIAAGRRFLAGLVFRHARLPSSRPLLPLARFSTPGSPEQGSHTAIGRNRRSPVMKTMGMPLFRGARAAVSPGADVAEAASAKTQCHSPPENPMKKAIAGFISLGALLHSGPSRNGADDPCGGCPKDFKCDLASLQCVPEDAHP